MTAARAIRWWPPVGVVAALVLGWAVGKRSTRVDDWFARGAHKLVGTFPTRLLVFTDRWLLGAVLAACLVAALYRRQWRLVVVMLVSPFAAIASTEAFKRLFERFKGPALAYPSGHMTVVVVTMGMVLLVTGCRLWAVTIAVAVSLLAMIGLACTFHYFTDTIGAVLLTSAIVCIAAQVAGRVPRSRGSPRIGASSAVDAV
jgi:hypothetical protein